MLRSILLLTCLSLPLTLTAQEIDVTDSVPDVTVDATDSPTTETGASHQEMTRDLVIQAIEDSNTGPIRKRLAIALMRRPVPSKMVTDRVTAAAIERGAIAIPPPTAWITGDVEMAEVQAAMDWSQIREIIKELLPLILQILAFF